MIVLIVLVIPVRLLANTVQVFVHALQHDLKVVEEVEYTARVNCDLCYLTWIGAFYKIFEDINHIVNSSDVEDDAVKGTAVGSLSLISCIEEGKCCHW